MRAVSIDLDAAEMMGVNVNQVILVTFFIGAVLAGDAGVLVGLLSSVSATLWDFWPG